jgi:hypothetical protein
MSIDVQALKAKIADLSKQVENILAISDMTELRREYQKWYSQVRHIVSVHVPDRLEELEYLYSRSQDYAGYGGIQSHLGSDGSYRPSWAFFRADLDQQQGILLSVPHIIELRALEVAALVTSHLVQGELNEGRLLLKHGFVRAAGAVAGVALESHLKLLHNQSGLTYTDKDGIVPLASNLRRHNIITLGDEKQCIAMADTRNKCGHKKAEDPTEEEVEELITDVDRFTKRVQVIWGVSRNKHHSSQSGPVSIGSVTRTTADSEP